MVRTNAQLFCDTFVNRVVAKKKFPNFGGFSGTLKCFAHSGHHFRELIGAAHTQLYEVCNSPFSYRKFLSFLSKQFVCVLLVGDISEHHMAPNNVNVLAHS